MLASNVVSHPMLSSEDAAVRSIAKNESTNEREGSLPDWRNCHGLRRFQIEMPSMFWFFTETAFGLERVSEEIADDSHPSHPFPSILRSVLRFRERTYEQRVIFMVHVVHWRKESVVADVRNEMIAQWSKNIYAWLSPPLLFGWKHCVDWRPRVVIWMKALCRLATTRMVRFYQHIMKRTLLYMVELKCGFRFEIWTK